MNQTVPDRGLHMNQPATQHRCSDGSWKPGRVRHCAACQGAGVKRPVKVKGRLES
jgi:DnaJ-class molecular chaperone